MIKYLSLACLIITTTGCMTDNQETKKTTGLDRALQAVKGSMAAISGTDDAAGVNKRIEWHKTDEYKNCKRQEKLPVSKNKAAWAKYEKEKSEYPAKQKQHEIALAQYENKNKKFKEQGGEMPMLPPFLMPLIPPPLISPTGCFNPPKKP